jgi:hypothetical protein
MKPQRDRPELVLRCGCRVPLSDEPRCPTHGVTTVARTSAMPAPTFRGVATGPHVRTEDLPPFVAPLVEQS